MNNLTSNLKFTRVENAAAAGQTDVTTDSIDMQGFNTAAFVASIGSIDASGTVDMHVEGSDDDSSWSNLTGASITQMGDTDDNQLAIVEVPFPRHRYLRAVVERGTSDSVVDSIVAIQGLADNTPVTHDSSTVADVVRKHAPAAAS